MLSEDTGTIMNEGAAHSDVIDSNQITISAERLIFNNVLVTTQDMSSFEYNMNHKYRGFALIFNHLEYDEETNLETRYGTEEDVKALQYCLPLLGFDPDHIIVKNDWKKADILKYWRVLRDENQNKLKDCDCIAVFVLTHGSKGNRIQAHDDKYDLYELVDKFSPKNFPELATKPKLFFINACRGDKLDVGLRLLPRLEDSTNDYIDFASEPDQVVSHPVHADILIGLSSHHEHTSFRNKHGSWYIQDFCNTIKIFSKLKKLDTVCVTELLMHTHLLVSQRKSKSTDERLSNNKQIPNYNNALCRKLYFKAKNK